MHRSIPLSTVSRLDAAGNSFSYPGSLWIKPWITQLDAQINTAVNGFAAASFRQCVAFTYYGFTFFYLGFFNYICFMTKKERIIDAATTLTPGKFMIWAQDEDYECIIENYDDVFDLSRDYAIIKVDGLRLEFESGKLKR